MYKTTFFSRHPIVLRLFGLSIFCFFVLIGFAQIQQVSSESGQTQILIPKDSPTPTPTPEKTHDVVAAYYDVENFPTAELLLNNKDIVAREIRPTLYNLDGNALEIAPVIVEANSHRLIDLNEWANLGGASFRQGSLKLFHTGKDLNIGSQVYLADVKNSLSFEERLTELGKFDSRRLESISLMPDNQTQVTVILSNTSEETLEVSAKLSRRPQYSGATQIFTLLPHQTRVLDLRKDFNDGNQFANAEIVGLSLAHTGENSALKAHGQVASITKGYSNIISFSNPNTAKSAELHGTGLHLGTINDAELTPIIAVKNVGSERTNVTTKIPYTRTNGTTGTVNLPSINLKIGEMRLLNLNQVVQRSRQEQIEIAGIEIKSDTNAGSVLVNAQSVAENYNQVYRVPMADPFAQTSSTGGYPWRIEETSHTVSYIKNTTDLEQEYLVYLTWENGGRYSLGLKKIAPHKSVEIDVKKLRDEQTADQRGNTIPLNQASGQFKWSLRQTYQTDNQKTDTLALIGRSEQIDTINKTSSSYACQNCCSNGDVGAFITTDPQGSRPMDDDYEFEVGDVVQYYGFLIHRNCYGEEEICWIAMDEWESNHPNIATVSSTGLVEIINAGDVEIRADADGHLNMEGLECPPGPFLTKVCESSPEKELGKGNGDMLVPPCGVCESRSRDFDPEADISAKPKVTNVTADGATKITQIVGNQNIIHFVTPKGEANSQITLTAAISPNDQQVLNQISWEGATESTSNPAQATLSKANAGKNVVKIKYGNQVLKELIVWVVWATIAVSETFPITPITGMTGNPAGPARGIEGGYTFTHTIQPTTIITDTDRPDFCGNSNPTMCVSNMTAPPGGNHPINGQPLSGGANKKWDVSRQIRFKIFNPDNINPNDTGFLPAFPSNLLNYPLNDVEGNDDRNQGDEIIQPYVQTYLGTLLGQDIPVTIICDRAGVNGNTFESRLQFREFTRLEIEGTWKRISDFYLWKFHRKLNKVNGVWVNDSSILALDNSGF